MKRVKTGRVEQIPNIDSAYEVEYLVRSFNEMTRNVTATKRALELKLEELRKANSELKQTQATLVQSAKMISLGQIVAGVAHELNNPIAFIYSNMHHLTEYLTKINQMVTEYRASRESLPEDQKRHLEQFDKDLEIDFILKDMVDLTQSCVEGAERTKEIVLGLRTFSRMDESNFRPNDLHEGLRSTVKLLTAELKGRIEVHEEFGDLPLVEGNLSQLNQVFMNLLSNAAQAIEGKGNIWIRTRVDGSHVVIEVEDTGSGMSPETVDKIFDPFFTTKRVGQGTGLGLSIAYGLIQKHHGTITVTSSAGQGTCFTLRLPITQPVTKNV
jgi:two-component system NtrC family sensor kinase